MPDDVTIKDANDASVDVAADLIGTTKHQRVKVQFGVDGSATDVSTVSPLPVGDAGGSLTVDGTVAVSNHPATVNVGNFPATQNVADGGGSITVDGFPSVQAVSDNGGSLTVDGTVGVSGAVDVSDRDARVLGRAKLNYPAASGVLWASATIIAPAANAVICDTGAMAAGDYRVEINAGCQGALAAGKCMIVEHRNAANGATLHSFVVPINGVTSTVWERVTVALNERIRVVNGPVAGEVTNSRYGGSIRAALL